MSQVFFLKDFNKLEKAIRKILSGFYSPGRNLLIKIHFGEPGNKTALFPKDVEPIIKVLKAQGIKISFLDTPVAYSSPRNNVKDHYQAAKERGWEKLGPIIISNHYQKIKTKDFSAEVSQELIKAKQVLVISHVKGHSCSGFGGAIKNLGMGGVSAKTKQEEHNFSKPRFNSECRGCGICAGLCPAKAIKMTTGKAKINPEACWGCSICQIECPHQCLVPQKALFDDLLAQGAAAVINRLPEKTFYANIIKNITQFCDCGQNSGKIIAPDAGILFSENPLAVDKASVNLVNKESKKEAFKEINHKDPLLQIRFAAKYTNFRPNYRLLKLFPHQ